MIHKKPHYLQIPSIYKPQNGFPGIPESISREYDIVPLWAQGDTYHIASADVGFDKVAEIELLVKRNVNVYFSTYPKIQRLQSQLYGNQSNDSSVLNLDTAAIASILKGNITRLENLETENSKTNQLTLLEQNFLEVLGIHKQLSHIDIESVVINFALSPLIPFEIAKGHQIIPLWWFDNQLIVGCNAAVLTDEIKFYFSLFDFNIQLVLCAERQWKIAFREIYLRGETIHTVEDNEIIQTLLSNELLDRNDLHRASIYSDQFSVSIVTALFELKLISPETILSAQATISGIQIIPPEILPKPEWLQYIPASIARLFEIVPFDGNEETISVASPYFSESIINMIESLAHLKVIPHYLTKNKANQWIQTNYLLDQHPSESLSFISLSEVLHKTGLLSREQLSEVDNDGNSSNRELGERLVSLEYIDDSDLAMALSLQTGLPFVSLEYSNIDSSLLKAFPKDLAERYQIIPVYQQNNYLWVASADPYNGRGFHAVKSALKCEVVPIIAPKNVIWAMIERSWEVSYRRMTRDTHFSIQKLISYDFLTQTQANEMIGLLSSQGLLFDEAFVQASFYNETQSNKILAETFKFSVMSLAFIEETNEALDAIGQIIQHVFYRDPVDPTVANLIDYETAKKYGMLPVQKEGRNIIVAFSNPLAIFNRNMFEALLAAPIKPVLVVRSELEEAIERNLGHKNIGTYLLENNIITRHQLNEALELANHTGVRIGQALLLKQYVHENQIYQFLAQQAGLNYASLEDCELDEKTSRLIDPEIEREYGMLPIEADENRIILAIVDPIDMNARLKAEEITGKEVQLVVTSDLELEKAFERIYTTDYTFISTSRLLERSPKESAFKVLSKNQKIFFIVCIILSLIWMTFSFSSFVITANVLITIFYIGSSVYKFYLIYHAMNHDNEVPISQEEVDALDDKGLPIYTLLVPVYKEAEVLPDLMKALSRIEYPAAKLDIKILMEEDDQETVNRFLELGLPPHFKGIVVPGSQPKTKPKACNYGLIHARGEYVVIFDAEDLPETDQLKKAVIAFQKSSPDVVCIQAKLNYFNRTQNLLTRWFTVEYSMWFDLFLPGLDASKAPIPLGGTSNHFKRQALVEVGAWDPHNVTEDADLGMRLYKRGYHTRTIDSTTYEEANSDLKNWIRQRSRWIKGYIQTWLVHMRDPIQLYREVGLKGFVSFQFVAGGTFFAALVNPILWAITTIWFLTKWHFIQETFPGIIFYLGSINLYLGNFIFTYMNVAGAMRREHYDNVRYALLSPLYWGLMSIGAWKGFLQLLTKPHYWEKTIHGLSPGTSTNQTDIIQAPEEDNNDE